MAERVRSKDGTRDTKEILGEAPEEMEPSPQQGSKGGELQRKVGTRDEKKGLDTAPGERTRPLGQDQDGSGDKEKV